MVGLFAAKRQYTVGDRTLELSARDVQVICKLLDKGNRIEAAIQARQRAGIELSAAKALLDAIDQQRQPGAVVAPHHLSFTTGLQHVLRGQLSLQHWLSTHQGLIYTTLVLCWVVVLSSAVISNRPAAANASSAAPEQSWYFDLNTGDLFVDRYVNDGKLTTADGHEAVRAYVFACGKCAADQRFVGWLEKQEAPQAMITEETQKALAAHQPMMIRQTSGRLVRGAEGEDQAWHAIETDAGRKLVDRALNRCGEQHEALPCEAR